MSEHHETPSQKIEVQVIGIDAETSRGLGELPHHVVDHGRSMTVYVHLTADGKSALYWHAEASTAKDWAEQSRDQIQTMLLAGNGMAAALAGFLGPDHPLIRLWDEAKP